MQFPFSPVLPVVVVNAPTSVSKCDVLTLDVTSSTGNGGREWINATAEVSSATGKNVDSLQKFLTKNFVYSPPLSIPLTLLQAGDGYTFVVRLCNFLGACSSNSKSVLVTSVALPIVSIPGSSVRSISRSQQLNLNSIAFLRTCNGSTSVSGLSYKWSVLTNQVELFSLKSVSLDPSVFTLPAYSLSVSTWFQIMLRVTDTSTQKLSVATISVYTQSGKVIAGIVGEVTKYLRLNQSSVIDGSSSYDEDTGSNNLLAYSWSQTQLTPTLNDSCSNNLEVLTKSLGIISIRPKWSADLTSSCQITLTVMDATGSRTSSVSIVIFLLPLLSPVATLGSNLKNNMLNQNSFLLLTAKISMPSNSKLNTSWSVDTTDVDLSANSLTPVNNQFDFSSVVASSYQTFTVYLSLPPNILIAGASLTFSLHCDFSSHTNTSVSIATTTSVIVTVNSPPKSGRFFVSPTAGVTLSTLFTFIASQWLDDQLPLSYEFAYYSTSQLYQVIRSKSELTFTTSQLPSGSAQAGYVLQTATKIFDDFGANTTVTFPISVNSTSLFNLSNYNAMLSSSVSIGGSSNTDRTRQTVTFGSSLLNQVDCALAPNCSFLNRKNCYKTPNTCGDCLNENFAGFSGDSNEKCVLLTSMNGGESGSKSCFSSADCKNFDQCESFQCVTPTQSCPSNCSQHGTCYFSNLDTNIEVSTCKADDIHCRAVCRCVTGYENSADCSISNGEIDFRRNLRNSLVDLVFDLSYLEDPTVYSVVAWTSMLSDAVQSPDELSYDTIQKVYVLCNRFLDLASAISLSYLDTGVLLSIIESVNHASSLLPSSTTINSQSE